MAYRLIDPGSEWRLHRHWYDHSAMGDLLGEDFAIAHSHTLYRCLDRLVVHKRELFSYLQACVFHAKLDTDSTASWTVIPRQAGHLFQGKLDT